MEKHGLSSVLSPRKSRQRGTAGLPTKFNESRMPTLFFSFLDPRRAVIARFVLSSFR